MLATAHATIERLNLLNELRTDLSIFTFITTPLFPRLEQARLASGGCTAQAQLYAASLLGFTLMKSLLLIYGPLRGQQRVRYPVRLCRHSKVGGLILIQEPFDGFSERASQLGCYEIDINQRRFAV